MRTFPGRQIAVSHSYAKMTFQSLYDRSGEILRGFDSMPFCAIWSVHLHCAVTDAYRECSSHHHKYYIKQAEVKDEAKKYG